MKRDDFRANHAHLVDKERWRRLQRIKDDQLRNDTSTPQEKMSIFESMRETVESIGKWPPPVRKNIPGYKLRLASRINAKLL